MTQVPPGLAQTSSAVVPQHTGFLPTLTNSNLEFSPRLKKRVYPHVRAWVTRSTPSYRLRKQVLMAIRNEPAPRCAHRTGVRTARGSHAPCSLSLFENEANDTLELVLPGPRKPTPARSSTSTRAACTRESWWQGDMSRQALIASRVHV